MHEEFVLQYRCVSTRAINFGKPCIYKRFEPFMGKFHVKHSPNSLMLNMCHVKHLYNNVSRETIVCCVWSGPPSASPGGRYLAAVHLALSAKGAKCSPAALRKCLVPNRHKGRGRCLGGEGRVSGGEGRRGGAGRLLRAPSPSLGRRTSDGKPQYTVMLLM